LARPVGLRKEVRRVTPKLVIPKAEHYAFFFDDVHLLVIAWERDQHREIYLIRDIADDVLTVEYPGDRYREQVWDAVGEIFFVSLEEDGDPSGKTRYVLGAYFERRKGEACAVYYKRPDETGNGQSQPYELLLLKVQGEPPDRRLAIPEEQEYQALLKQFRERYAGLLAFADA
jgi:hypothetical protein